MRVWGTLTKSAYCDVKELPIHLVEVELDDSKINDIIIKHMARMKINKIEIKKDKHCKTLDK